MSFKCECPFCHQHYEAEDQDRGVTFECISCHRIFTLTPRRKEHKKILPTVVVLILFLLVLLFYSGTNFGRVFYSDRPVAGRSIRNESYLKQTINVKARDSAQACKIARYYIIRDLAMALGDFDVKTDFFPYGAAENDLGKLIVKEEVRKDESSQFYTVTLLIDISKFQKLVPFYWEVCDISNSDIAQVFQQRAKVLKVLSEIDSLFEDYPNKIYSGIRKGMFELASRDVTSDHTASMDTTYELRFNLDAYAKFEKRLKNLLSKVAVAETSGQASSENFWGEYRGTVASFNNSKESKSWPTGTKTIIFCDEADPDGKLLNYHFFAVPNQVYEKIDALTDTFCVLVFQFDVRGKDKPLKRYIQPSIRFFRQDDWGRRKTIDFRNRMWINIPDYERRYATKSEFKITWSFSEDDIRSMKSCTLKIYSGQTARYLWYVACRDEYEVRRLARDGYIPAMIAQAEIFNNPEWYNNAALMGSRHAQEKCGWQNGGLGFEVMPEHNGFVVWSARKGVPVKKGMVLKTINGAKVPQRTEELGKLIGAFSPGESVSVEFTNGKKISIRILEK